MNTVMVISCFERFLQVVASAVDYFSKKAVVKFRKSLKLNFTLMNMTSSECFFFRPSRSFPSLRFTASIRANRVFKYWQGLTRLCIWVLKNQKNNKPDSSLASLCRANISSSICSICLTVKCSSFAAINAFLQPKPVDDS